MSTLRPIIFLLALIAAIMAPCSVAATPTIIAEADSAYADDDFAKAATLYQAALDSLGPNSDLQYNLGNAYYRQGKLGKAVLAYERALRLDPSNKDARANLDFVNSKIIDRPGERGTLLGNMLDAAATSTHSNTWAWIAFAEFMLLLGAIALYMFSPVIALRKLGFFGGIILVLFVGFSIFLSCRCAAYSSATDQAVITVPSTILSTTPREPRQRSEEAILLHDGTRMTILDSVSSRVDSVKQTWVDVQIDNTHRAWINRDAIEII